MDSNLSLPSETVAKAHYRRLKPSEDHIDLSTREVRTLEEHPRHRALRHLLSQGGIGGVGRAIRRMNEQMSSVVRKTGFAAGIAQAEMRSLSTAIRQMEGALGGARANFAQAIAQSHEELRPVSTAVQQMEGAFGGLGGSVGQAIALAQTEMRPLSAAIQEMEGAFGGLGGSVGQAIALAQAQAAEGAPALREGEVSTNVREINFYLNYLVYTVPSVTWEWMQKHPVATNLLVALLLWVVPSPYEFISEESTHEGNDNKKSKVVVPSRLETKRKPSSTSITKDTLYHNNTGEKIDEHGDWVKIEYEDHIEGKKKKGWVLNYFLDSEE